MPTAGSRHRTARRAGLLLGLLGLIIAVQGGVVVPSSPVVSVQPEQAAAAAPPTDNSTRPDRVSAMVTAIAAGAPVEDLSQRTQTTQVFANPDGTWTADTAAAPVRVQDTDGEWHDIDTTLVARSGGFAPAYATSDVVFSNGGDKVLAAMTEADRDLAWKTAANLPAPVLNGSTATYAGAAAGGADLVVTATPTGFEQSIVLHQAPTSELSLVTPVTTDGARLTETAQGGLRITADGETLVTAPAPAMWDSSIDASGSPDNTAPVDTAVTTSGATTRVTLRPDQDFLTDPDTVYPVTVDPTYSTDVSADTYITNASGTQVSQESSTQLWVGTNDGGTTKARGLIRWATQPWIGQDVVSASLRLQNFYSTNCTAASIMARRITGSWRADTVTWANQPSASTTDQAAFGTAYGATGCAANEAAWNVTDMVTHAADGTAPMQGIQLIANVETNNASWRKYRSSETNYAPHMIVTYNQRPGTPTKPSVTPGNAGYATTGRPTFTSTISDADGASRGVFYVYNSGGTQIWTGSTGALTGSSAKATITIPTSATALADGVYTVKTRGYDGRLYSSAYSSSTSFTVDTVKPSATITATGFTNGQWTTTAPTSNTFTLNGSTGTKSFTLLLDGVVQPAKTADGNGDVTLSWLPAAGSHQLTATPTDNAGNAGAAASFGFGVGPAAFVNPTSAMKSTGVFPVQLSGPPNATGASLSWRYATSATWTSATAVTTTSGQAWTGTSTTDAGTGGSQTPALLWDATSEEDPSLTSTPPVDVQSPAVLQLLGCFTYSGTTSKVCTTIQTVQLVPSAFGDNFPVTTIGPAEVALYTGEVRVDATDVSTINLGLTRTFSSFNTNTLTGGLFGPGWSAPAVLSPATASNGQVIDNRSKDGSFVIVNNDGSSRAFIPDGTNNPAGYHPVDATGDSTSLMLSGTNQDTLKLIEPRGTGSTVTTWTLNTSDTGGSSAWVLGSVDQPGTSDDIAINADHQRPTWIRQSDPSVATTCSPTIQTAGCRALVVAYTGTGSDTRVASVALQVGASSQAQVTTSTVATYTYDSSGRLATACSAAPSAGKPALCDAFTYTSVAGRTLMSQMTPPGQTPWRFTYTSSGHLQNVKRQRPASTDDAVWSIDDGLSVNSTGLPDLSSSNAASWGQLGAPAHVFAVYPPATSTPNIANATLYYTDDHGSVTNTATYGPSGWLVTSYWYDDQGNIIQQLDGGGWARVQAASAADRPAVAAQASSYMKYNDYGDDDLVNTEMTDSYSSAHIAQLDDGTTGLFRSHQHVIYDDDPTVPTALIATRPGTDPLGLPVKTVTSTSDVAMTMDFDEHATEYGYDPLVTGDTSGWDLGVATSVRTQVDGSQWSTVYTRYDDAGREIESRRPGATIDTSGSGNDARTTKTTYYTTGGTGDCGSHPEWAGMLCKTGPAAQPTGTPIPSTYYASYNRFQQPMLVKNQTSGADARTTTTSYDDIGRTTGTSVSTVGSGVLNEELNTLIVYDNASGLATRTTSAGSSVDTTYDTWGRVIGYTDAQGQHSSTSYDSSGQVATVNDGSAVYTYNYDSRGRLASVDAGGGVGSFVYAYRTDGQISSLTYPNGLQAKTGYSESGDAIGLTYVDSSGQSVLDFSRQLSVQGDIVAAVTPASSQQFSYDGLQRLTEVRDQRSTGCTVRNYGFDQDSNRTSLTTFDPDPQTSACQTSTAGATNASGYDTASRIRDNGYAYDALGRTVGVPKDDVGLKASGDVMVNYHANDMLATTSGSVKDDAGIIHNDAWSYALDPTDRISSAVLTTDGTEQRRLNYLYSSASDSPAVVKSSTDAGTTWSESRYVSLPGVGMVATVTASSVVLQLSDLNGNTVATMNVGSSGPDSYAESDEFGNSVDGLMLPGRYGWLGSRQRSRDSLLGIVLMGARAYNPRTGLFLSMDSVAGGTETPYAYPQDPINTEDTSGTFGCKNDDCRRVYAACKKFAIAPKCAFLGRLLKYDLKYALTATDDPNEQNAGRHFAFMVMSAVFLGVAGARALGVAHEIASTNPFDSERDQANNAYALGWYQRHTAYANGEPLTGGFRTRGDIRRLFWHGVGLYRSGYMYGLCNAGDSNIQYTERGPCPGS